MYNTGLPYDMNLLTEISTDGAVVDMNNINFPEATDQEYTAFVFLRNTGFTNIKLDFSSCQLERKEKYLLNYLQKKIELNNIEFSNEWILILCQYCGVEVDNFSILTKDESKLFIENNKEYIKQVLNFVVSLPLYAMYKFRMNKEVYDVEDSYEKCNVDSISTNICNLLNYDELNSIIILGAEIEKPKFYSNMFTIENKNLYESIDNLLFYKLLISSSIVSVEDWKNGVETLFKNEVN